MPAPTSSLRSQIQPRWLRRAPVPRLLQFLLALMLLSGCAPEPEPEPAPAPIVEPDPEPVAPPPPPPALLPAAPTLPDPMTSGSYLSRHLPADTVAYLRLPNPWASLGDVVGRPSDAAYASVAWRQQMELLKNAVRAVSVKDQWPDGLAEALVYVDGPVEMALLSEQRPLSTGARLWISAKMRSADPAPIEQWLRMFEVAAPAVGNAEPHIDSDDPASAAPEGAAADEAAAETEQTDSDAEQAAPVSAQTAAAAPRFSFGSGGLATLDIGLSDPVLLRFDQAERRLHALINIGPAPERATSVLSALSTETTHPARGHLEALDHSGRGLAAWFDPEVLLANLPTGEHQIRTMLQLGSSWAFAIGTVDGHGQIALSAGGVDPELVARLPKGMRQLPITSAANPDWAIALALPSAAEWEALRSWANPQQDSLPSDAVADTATLEATDPDAAEADLGAPDAAAGGENNALASPAQSHWVDQIDALMRSATGISATTVFSRIGPELVLWQDSAGRFAAVRVKDPDGFDSLLEYMSRQLSGILKMRRWNGMDIHEFSFLLQPEAAQLAADTSTGEIDETRLSQASAEEATSPSSDQAETATASAEPEAQPAEPGWTDTLRRLRGRAYWVEEEQFLVAAKLPQVLADRQFSRDKTTLQSWLKDDQARDPAGSIALATAVSDNLQRDSYHGMISVLQNLGDLLEVEVDPYAFPNADELRLPEQGAVSARLGIDGNRLSLALSYEDSPAELLQGPGGLATVAAAGLLTAVALPAIADYRAREQLRSALNDAVELRAQIGAYVDRRKRWPRQIDALGTSQDAAQPEQTQPLAASWQLDAERLQLQFSPDQAAHEALRGKQLSLRLIDGRWQCDPEHSSVAEHLAAPVCAEFSAAEDANAAPPQPATD